MEWFWGNRNGFWFLKLIDCHKVFHHATQKDCDRMNEKGNGKGKWSICNTPTVSPATASLVAQTVKCLPTMQETQVWSLGQQVPLEREMATHSRILAWKIPWMEEPGRLQSMGSQRVGQNWATSLHFPSLRHCTMARVFKNTGREQEGLPSLGETNWSF